MRRVISVWLPRFATDRLERKNAGGRSKALAATLPSHGRLIVTAANRLAAEAGIGPGQALADARALLPDLAVVEADAAGDARALEALAEWCGRYSPFTQVDHRSGAIAGGLGVDGWGGDGGLWIDATGVAHLFGGEADLLQDLLCRFDRLGFVARAAVADTPGAAWAMARFGRGGSGPSSGLAVPEGGIETALASLPVAALRLPGVTIQGLNRLGLKRIGDLFDMPRAPLAERFGDIPLRRLDQLLGRLDEPLSPRVPLPPFRARLGMPEPIGTPEDIARAARWLLGRLAGDLDRAHRGLRRAELVFFRADGQVRRLAIGTGRPVRDPDRLFRLFAQHFDKLDPGPGIEVAELWALRTETLEAAQLTLAAEPPTASLPPPATAADSAVDLVDRLANRLGDEAVSGLQAKASHIPERASYRRRWDGSEPARPPRGSKPPEVWRRYPRRPVRLFARPEPIEAVAPLPDHPPVLFRWRGGTHKVARAVGPERIAPEWWREDRATRDYFRVEDAEGRRFWVYRDGLYRQGAATPRWYMHGLFA